VCPRRFLPTAAGASSRPRSGWWGFDAQTRRAWSGQHPTVAPPESHHQSVCTHCAAWAVCTPRYVHHTMYGFISAAARVTSAGSRRESRRISAAAARQHCACACAGARAWACGHVRVRHGACRAAWDVHVCMLTTPARLRHQSPGNLQASRHSGRHQVACGSHARASPMGLLMDTCA